MRLLYPLFLLRINRYIMECKFFWYFFAASLLCFELIDTLWNVNQAWEIILAMMNPELIDTLWNVNVYSLNSFVSDNGINRYIMECKWTELFRVGKFCFELIDTLWNVNLWSIFYFYNKWNRINRYIMECKFF